MNEKFCQRIINLSRHPYAPYYLFVLSLVESFIVPITPLLLQVPLLIANPQKASRITWYAVVGSILGGIIGYAIGYFGMHTLFTFLITNEFYDVEQMNHWIRTYGLWIVFFISISPLPFKITTISSGMLGVAFPPFLLLTAIARYLHFFIITFAFLYGNKKLHAYLSKRYGRNDTEL